MWKALSQNKIDIIATDHAPHTIYEKEKPYENAPSGMPGLETMLPLLLDAYNNNKISIKTIIRLTSANPAAIFKIRGKGFLREGYDADITVIDLKKARTVKNDELYTKCKWSAFNGWRLKGWPVMTFVNGNLIYDNGTLNEIKASEVDFYE